MLYSSLALYLVTFLISFTLIAQETITTSGGNKSETAGSITYTVGQVAYVTQSGTPGLVVQGVQQPYWIPIVASVDHFVSYLSPIVYPNPSTSDVVLHFDHWEASEDYQMSYRIYDHQGRELGRQEIEREEHTIPMDDFSPGVYLLKIYLTQSGNSSGSIKAFRIIKY